MFSSDTLPSPLDELKHLSEGAHIDMTTPAFAAHLDALDPLAKSRQEFFLPHKNGSELVYLCGNSLGLQLERSRELVLEELDVWAERGVQGHFDHPKGRAWAGIDLTATDLLLDVVGAKEASEVVAMQSLTANLHLLMLAFYKPTAQRFKIMMEKHAFPSDQYAIASQLKLHGLDPETALVEVAPREGEYTLRTEDITRRIEEEGESIALIIFSGVQYYTGQAFDMPRITEAGHAKGCVVGFDLAHAVGNIPLRLHEWGIDFACWCTYKYLNSGPGGTAGLFVHKDFSSKREFSGLAGWWGHNRTTRFDMPSEFVPIPGAHAFQLSNTPVLTTASLIGSLLVLKEAGGMDSLRAKSLLLTGYMEYLLELRVSPREFIVMTPRDPRFRGCQLSLIFPQEGRMMEVFRALEAAGIICDERKPDCIRLAPVPLYNTFTEVWTLVDTLRTILGPKDQ